MNKIPSLIFFFYLATGSLSCGYVTHSSLPSHIKTIYVEPLKNNVTYTAEGSRNIYLPLLEVDVRKAIVSRFLFDGNLKISEADTADMVLKGQVNNYERTPLRYTDNDDVEEYRIQIFASLEMHDTQKQEVIWSDGIVGEASYFVTGPLAKSESAALSDAITDLARRVVERTIEDW